MNALEEIVNSLTYEDSTAFTEHLKAKNNGKNGLTISLFKSLKTDMVNVSKNNKEARKDAAYHTLRKRLYDTLVDFLASRSFENDTSQEHEVLRLLIVARVFLEQNLDKAAFKALAKAEVKALQIDNFSLLNEICHTLVQYAHRNTALSLDTLIEKYKANRQKLEREEKLNLAYAVLRRELAEIMHAGKITDLQKVIADTMKVTGVAPDEVLTFKSLYQILFIANEYASLNNNFKLIEDFVLKAYVFITGREHLAERHLYYHIYILYFMANMHFRNREFAVSKSYLEIMEAQLHRQDKKYYSRFILRYYLLLSLNENYTGNPGKAEHVAKKALAEHKKADVKDLNDLRLGLTVFYLQLEDGREAAKVMVQFNQTDAWYEKNMGMDWAIKKALLELITYKQQEYTDLAVSRLTSFKRRYRKYLISVGEERVLAYLKLLDKYINKPESIKTAAFQQKLEELLDSVTAHEDVFVLSFLGWLKARAEKKVPYYVIMEMIG